MDEIVFKKLGGEGETNFPRRQYENKIMILTCKSVSKTFGKLTAIDDLSFTVEHGEIFGIAGPNGSGKTTLFNMITGVYPYSGKIFFNGHAINGLSSHQVCHKGIARTFQIPQLASSLSVYDNIRAAAQFGAKLNRHKMKESIKGIVEFTGLQQLLHVSCNKLKLLDKKLAMIAAALATGPKLLLLDEPIAGLNPTEISQTVEMFKKINQELDITLIIIEHFMKVLTELSNRMMILENGQLICIGSPVETMSNSRVIECYLGDGYA